MSMSQREEWWSCKRKQAYSKKEANHIALLRGATKNKGISAYQCEYCGWWHLTSRAHLQSTMQSGSSPSDRDKRVMKEAAEDAKHGMRRVRGEDMPAPQSGSSPIGEKRQ